MSCYKKNDRIEYIGPDRPNVLKGTLGYVTEDYDHTGFVQCEFNGFEDTIEEANIKKVGEN
jgi:hypothetical protein